MTNQEALSLLMDKAEQDLLETIQLIKDPEKLEFILGDTRQEIKVLMNRRDKLLNRQKELANKIKPGTIYLIEEALYKVNKVEGDSIEGVVIRFRDGQVESLYKFVYPDSVLKNEEEYPQDFDADGILESIKDLLN